MSIASELTGFGKEGSALATRKTWYGVPVRYLNAQWLSQYHRGLSTKSTLRTTGAKAASHHFPYKRPTSQPHGSITTRPSSVRDSTIGLNELTLLFEKLAVTPAHDPHHNFQSAKVPVSAEHSRLDVEEGAPKEQNRDQNDPAPGTTEPTPPTHYEVEAIIDQKWSKSQTGESENEAAVHVSPAVSDVSTAHHGTVHTSAPVATLTFSSDFSSTQDLDQDVEMADAFEAPFEACRRPAGLPTWLTDYGYSWYLRMLNRVNQDVEMVEAWDKGYLRLVV
ncbi:hypothetical protein BU17DRAFT_96020 [Hysterangium stoloniferum]|nr:hypothetical protein BU17DRAFT_96020 [Hysterangium stoloniferum]